MFTDAKYGSVDFDKLEIILKQNYTYVDSLRGNLIGMGKSFFIGHNESELLKLDLYYTDKYVFLIIYTNGIRLANIEEIAAMKLDVVGRGGRKKDFWDLHEILNHLTIDTMIECYVKRYPYNHSRSELIHSLSNFDTAENDFIPICLKNKIWDIIKLDFEQVAQELRSIN